MTSHVEREAAVNAHLMVSVAAAVAYIQFESFHIYTSNMFLKPHQRVYHLDVRVAPTVLINLLYMIVCNLINEESSREKRKHHRKSSVGDRCTPERDERRLLSKESEQSV